jgi:dUTPase
MNIKTVVKIKLEEGAKIPIKGEPNAMCYDCFAHNIKKNEFGKIEVDLGFSATPPHGYGIRLIPRSGITKFWWSLNNSIGIGDPDYKGNYKAIFTPMFKGFPMFGFSLFEDFPFNIGDRVCQMEIYEKIEFEFEQVDTLPGNDRGGGFGSTGTN